MDNIFTVGEVVPYSGVYRITHYPTVRDYRAFKAQALFFRDHETTAHPETEVIRRGSPFVRISLSISFAS